MTIYTLHITATNSRHPGVTVYFAAESTDDRPALASALIAVNRLTHAIDQVDNVLVMGPRQVALETVQSLGVLHGLRGCFDLMLVSDTDYQDAYLNCRIRRVGFSGLSDEDQSLLEVWYD